jgi:hypothetical protein
MSIAAPSAGLAVMPEKPSEPPHSRPILMWLPARAGAAGVGLGQHLLDGADAGLDGLARAAHFLHHHGAQQAALLQALRIHQVRDLVALAAQADDQHAGQVGMARVAGQRAAQQVEVRAGRRHAAAGGLREGGDAVDVRKVLQPLGREVRGDAA